MRTKLKAAPRRAAESLLWPECLWGAWAARQAQRARSAYNRTFWVCDRNSLRLISVPAHRKVKATLKHFQYIKAKNRIILGRKKPLSLQEVKARRIVKQKHLSHASLPL